MPPWQQDPALQQQWQQANAQAQQQQQQQATPNPNNGANPGTQVADSTNQAFGLGGTIQSKKVKTLAVRPDGSVVADNASNNDNTVDPNAMQMPAIAQGDGRRLASRRRERWRQSESDGAGDRRTMRMLPINSRPVARMMPTMPTMDRHRSGRIT